MIKHKKNLSTILTPSGIVSPVGTTQFGASLQFIKENNGGDPIPPIVRQCIDFLKTPEGKTMMYEILFETNISKYVE